MYTQVKNQQEAADKISHIVARELNAGCHLLLLVPGGSAARVAGLVFENLARQKAHTERLIITLTDERFGVMNHPQSNWPAIFEASKHLPDAQFLPVLQGEDMQTTAEAWEATLRKRLNMADKTIALFGIGTDGHIAGIKPNSIAAEHTTHLVVAYDAPDYHRITISPAMFTNLDYAHLYAEGHDKAAILEKLDAPVPTADMPAQLIKHCENVFVYYMNS